MYIRVLAQALCAIAVLTTASTLRAAAVTQRFPIGTFHVGAHVLGDPMAMHRWIACTITAVHPSIVLPGDADSYSAKCADGIEYILIADADHVKGGGSGGSSARAASHVAPVVNAQALQARYHSSQYHRVNTGAGPLRTGVYHCIAGFSTMLTYGDFTVSGYSYSFRAPDGSGGSGTYTADANGGLHWNGNFGVLSRPPWIIESSNKQAYVPDAISFYYHSVSSPIHRSMSCRRR